MEDKMKFQRHREEIVLFDAAGKPLESWVEIRVHPVTGETSRIIHVPLKKVTLPDLKGMAAKTREGCPFCPEQLSHATPRFREPFLREWPMKQGESVLIPNRFPYDRYCALIILTEDHYVPLDAWDVQRIMDGLSIAQEFLRRVMDHDTSTQSFSLNWNFAPHSGSSILHPHLQLSAGSFATNRARRLLDASYLGMLKGRDIIAEWIEAEQTEGARWCGQIGLWHIILAFAPRGRFFEINLIHESLGSFPALEEEDLETLAKGVRNALNFVTAMGFVSMNLSLFSPLRNEGTFHPIVSISPRACIGPFQISDISFQMLIDEFFALFLPEEVARRFQDSLAS